MSASQHSDKDLASDSGLPLAGIRVADFSWYAAGPYCTLMLGMLGAEIIRLESRKKPDSHRKNHPMYGRDYVAPYDQLLSSRLSAALNLKHERAPDIARALVAKSDIVVENYRPGVMARFGLGYDDLVQVKPDIIMLSVSTAGQTGPDANQSGYAPIFSAAAGLGGANGFPGGPPLEMRNAMDHVCGLAGAFAVLNALRQRQTGGGGTYIDLANREVAALLMGHVFVDYCVRGREPIRTGNRSAYAAPHNVYPCRDDDSWVSIAVLTDVEWRGLRAAMDEPAWAADEMYDDIFGRKRHEDELDQQIAAWSRALDPYEVTMRCQRVGVAAFPVMTGRDMVLDPHLQARKTVIELEHPELGSRVALNSPWRFSRADVRNRRWSPTVGQDNDFVYGQLLGMPTEQIRELENEQLLY